MKFNQISYTQALSDLVKYSVPASLGMIIRNGMDIVSWMFIGHLDNSDYISGIGLGLFFTYVFFRSQAVGLGGGIETLWSQAFGAKNKYLAGVFYNSSQIIITILFLFQLIVFVNSEKLLLLVGQPEASAHYAAQMIILYLPGLYFTCTLELFRKYLSCQGVYYLILKVQTFTLILHTGLMYIFLVHFHTRLYGVAMLFNFYAILNYILTLGFTKKQFLDSSSMIYSSQDQNDGSDINLGSKETVISFTKWNRNALHKIWEYLKYGIPSCLMFCLRVWFTEILTLFTGWMGSDDQSVWIILYNLSSFMYMIPMGMSHAASNLVGNSLGANNYKNAKTYAYVIWIFALVFSAIFTIIGICFKHEVAICFSHHQKIIDLTEDLFPIISFWFICDFVEGSSSGTIRALGYQKLASIITFLSIWLVAFPWSYTLAFKLNMGQRGLWYGYLTGRSVLALAYTIIIGITDWKKVAAEAVYRIHKEQELIQADFEDEDKT